MTAPEAVAERPAGRTLVTGLRAWRAWWLSDLAPLPGPLRFVFYTALLVLALTAGYRSPLAAPELWAWTDPDLYTPLGLFAWTGVEWVTTERLVALRAVTVAAWICAALGFFRGVTPAVAGLGFLVLHGVSVGMIGVSHRWYLPAYALVAMAFARSTDRWSLDHLLGRHWEGYPRQDGPPLARTGFARKLVLLFAVTMLFSGGVAKLLEAGPAWLDGTTLQFAIARSGGPEWPWLSELLQRNLGLCRVLAWATLTLELGAPLALLSRRVRHLFLAGACGFHVGIFLVMSPEYWAHMWCYVLLVDWERLRWRAPARRAAPLPAVADVRLGLAGGALLCALLGVVTFARIEWWPLSHVPMYAAYRGPEGAFTPEHLRDGHQAQALARACRVNTHCSWSKSWLDLRAVSAGGRERDVIQAARLARGGSGRGVRTKQFWRVILDIATEDLAAKPPGAIAFDPTAPELPGNRRLRELIPALRRLIPQADRYRRVELVCHLASGPVVIAAVDLHG